jgi:hypothetical protein
MRCPRCGSTNRVELAPGFFRCAGVVTLGLVAPGAPGNPTHAAVPMTQICGLQYQESTPDSAHPKKCGCGMFAVGECTTCNRPVCGACIYRNSVGMVVCSQHQDLMKDKPAPTVVLGANPTTVHDHLQAAEEADRLRNQRGARATRDRREDEGLLAEKLAEIVMATVSAVVEAKYPRSLSFSVQTSERRKGLLPRLSRGLPHISDPTGIATHSRERSAEVYGQIRTYCDFSGVYPLLLWVANTLPGPHGTKRAQLGGLWCNTGGTIIASSRPFDGIVIREPQIDLMPRGSLPTGSHEHDWLPTPTLLAPVPFERISADVLRVVVAASELTSTSGLEAKMAERVAGLLRNGALPRT